MSMVNVVEEKILACLETTDVESDVFSPIAKDAVEIGKLSIEERKQDLAEEEAERKATNEAVKLEIEQKKVENDAEKNRIEDVRLELDEKRLEFEREKAERDAEIEKAKLKNERIIKGIELGGKIIIAGGLILICAAGVPLKDQGIIPEKLPFYNIATKIVARYV